MCNVIDRCKGWMKINDILFYAILFYSFCIITFASDCDVGMAIKVGYSKEEDERGYHRGPVRGQNGQRGGRRG